jgi:Acyltransferase
MSRIVNFSRYARKSLSKPLTFAREKPRKPVSIIVGRIRRRLRRTVKELTGNGMILTTKALFRVELVGQKNYDFTPGTVMACTHKSSADIPVVIPRLCLWKIPNRRKEFHTIYEMTREDLFEDGFLIGFFPHLNKYRRLLSKINMGGYFDWLQARPIKTPDEQTISQLLHEIKRLHGNLPAVTVLAQSWRKRIFEVAEADNPALTLSDAIMQAGLDLLMEFATPEMFNEPFAAEMRKRHRETLIKQMREFTRLLEKGETFFIHPEGEITLSGSYGKTKAALMRIVQNCRADITLLPVCVTYDFMDTLRPKAIAHIGQQIRQVNQLSKTELADLLDAKLPALGSITMSGLASQVLINLAETGQGLVRRFQLRDLIWEEVNKLRHKTIHLDSQIYYRQTFEDRFNRFLTYCLNRPDVFASSLDTPSEPLHYGDEWLSLNLSSILREDCNGQNDHPVRYCYNELGSVLAAHNLAPEPAKPLLKVIKLVATDQRAV